MAAFRRAAVAHRGAIAVLEGLVWRDWMSRPIARREFLHVSAAGGTVLGAAVASGIRAQPAPEDETPDARGVVHEPARDLPVSSSCDVLVVGGGIAGVAAAVAAARNGAATMLIEREQGLGGLATLGNVVVYLPLCDGLGNQVIAGLGEELLKLSVRDGFNPLPACWLPGGDPEQRRKTRYQVTFNPASYLLDLEEMVVRSRVRLLYDTRFCDVLREGDRIAAVLVENKSGRSAIRARTVVDASGDADVCARAGEKTVSLRTNVAAGWFYTHDRRQVRLVTNSEEFPRDPRQTPKGVRTFAGDDAEDVTAQVLVTRQMIRQHLARLRAEAKGGPVFAAVLPSVAGFRMTRRLGGRMVLLEEHSRRWFDDAVGMTGDWRSAGPVYCLPLSCLAGVANENLIAAGRCISADGPAWDVTRVIPTCAVTGEAAGTAAALAARMAGGRLADLGLPALQECLRRQGVLIDRRLATGG
jgi:ribulose 1,5-bisphosphate synthetase/thiazole synthase